jgi:hypothetical protein
MTYKIEENLFLCFINCAPPIKLQIRVSTSSLAGDEWSASRPGRRYTHPFLLDRRLGGSESWSTRCGEDTYHPPLHKIEPRLLYCPACSSLPYRLSYLNE